MTQHTAKRLLVWSRKHIFCFMPFRIQRNISWTRGCGGIVTSYLVNSSFSFHPLCLCWSLFLPLRGDFVQLPSTVRLRLLCPTFTSIRPILSLLLLFSYSTASSAAVLALITMLGGKTASRESSCLIFFLLFLFIVIPSYTLDWVSSLVGCR